MRNVSEKKHDEESRANNAVPTLGEVGTMGNGPGRVTYLTRGLAGLRGPYMQRCSRLQPCTEIQLTFIGSPACPGARGGRGRPSVPLFPLSLK